MRYHSISETHTATENDRFFTLVELILKSKSVFTTSFHVHATNEKLTLLRYVDWFSTLIAVKLNQTDREMNN